jgi:DNA-binding GntR family transcriptional regulator
MSMATEDHAGASDGEAGVPALHLRVLDALGEAIVSGELAPGRRLTLDDLQQHYHVSRTLARDTMRVLEAMNLVYSPRGFGPGTADR